MILRFLDVIDTIPIKSYAQNMSPVISAMCETLQIPQIIDREFGYMHICI